MKLIIGNKNYSSWSWRPWIAMKVAGHAFDEEVISLNAPDFKQRLLQVSGTGKVPTLIDGDVHVWESLAILEYVAEKFPQAKLWPSDPAARAHARAIANEMHAAFLPLRRKCPMNLWRPVKKLALDEDALANVRRIDAREVAQVGVTAEQNRFAGTARHSGKCRRRHPPIVSI